MTGLFVISLDFELMWGVRDHRTVADYGDAILGGRSAIPRMLSAFQRHRIRATWATVGFLFARNRTELIDGLPTLHPHYRDARLDPYPCITSGIGGSEASDPYHFGRSLVDLIADTEGQELATHTHSHYYCLEPGQTEDAFRADLKAAVASAAEAGLTLRSIVFPRNQMSDGAVRICVENGIPCVRGNPESYIYRPRGQDETSAAVRILRTMDGLLPLPARTSARPRADARGAVNIPASRFFCPRFLNMPGVSEAFVHRIKSEMRHAARHGEVYHLWWHPHNFGRDTDSHLSRLESILSHFGRLADDYGMRSVTMADCIAIADEG